MNGAEKKDQKVRYITSATICTSPDPNIYLPHWKYVCSCLNKLQPLSLTDEEKRPSPFMS